jgi:hypothetical protein
MAEHETEHGDGTVAQGRPNGQPGSFTARLLANLALGVELQRAHRSRITAA